MLRVSGPLLHPAKVRVQLEISRLVTMFMALPLTESDAIRDEVAAVGLSWQRCLESLSVPTAKIQSMAHGFPTQLRLPRSLESH